MRQTIHKPKIGLMVLKQILPDLQALVGHVDFFQVSSEEYVGPQAVENLVTLKELSALRPIHVHSIDLSIGSHSGPDETVLTDLEKLHEAIGMVSLSDHLGFSKAGALWTGMPILNLPYTEEAIQKTIENIRLIQTRFGNTVPFFLENNSHCIDWPNSQMREEDFTGQICEKSGSKLLLDITNMYADSNNYGFDPQKYIDNVSSHVGMLHVAGGDWLDGYSERKITRGHYKKVEEEVWGLLDYALSRTTPEYIVLERVRNINAQEIADDLKRLREMIS